MAVKIVTDSVADIPTQLAGELGITIIPLNVHFGEKTYRDGIDLTTEQFYEKLAQGKLFPTTTVPPLSVYVNTFEKLAEETREIVAITFSHKLGAGYSAAVEAKGLVKRKCRIEVIDSGLAAMAQGLIVIEAARAAKQGASFNEVLDLTRRNILRADIRMVFDTLEYLSRGGRIGKAQVFLGAVLNVNPVLGIKDGEVYPFAREHSRAKAIEYLHHFVAGFSRIDGLAVEDATTPAEADKLVEQLSAKFPRERIYRAKVTPAVGVHVGPRVLAVSVLGDRR